MLTTFYWRTVKLAPRLLITETLAAERKAMYVKRISWFTQLRASWGKSWLEREKEPFGQYVREAGRCQDKKRRCDILNQLEKREEEKKLDSRKCCILWEKSGNTRMSFNYLWLVDRECSTGWVDLLGGWELLMEWKLSSWVQFLEPSCHIMTSHTPNTALNGTIRELWGWWREGAIVPLVITASWCCFLILTLLSGCRFSLSKTVSWILGKDAKWPAFQVPLDSYPEAGFENK